MANTTTTNTKTAHHLTAAERRAYEAFRSEGTCSTDLYTHRSDNHKKNAQANLAGRSHWADDDTLAAFNSRIIRSGTSDNGLTFYVLESLTAPTGQRVYRPAIFDLFGRNIAQLIARKAYDMPRDLPHYWPVIDGAQPCQYGYLSKATAERALWHLLNLHDAATHTAERMAERLEWVKHSIEHDLALLRPLMRAEARQRKLEADGV